MRERNPGNKDMYHPIMNHQVQSMSRRKFAEPMLSKVHGGLTIVEVLIATTITLLMMLMLAQGFKALSESVSAGRSKLTLSDQLRGISSLLRSDLDGLTANNTCPQNSLAGNGYLKYYDGPICDATAALFNYQTVGTVEQRVSAGRWGDIDDVLMFTSKAKHGEWFRGRVPKALLLINNLNKGIAVDANTDWNLAWETDVAIASPYAEIVWFMRPLQQSDQSATAPANKRNPIFLQELMASSNNYANSPPETSVEDVAPGVDLDGDTIPDPDGMPDRIALCRRVLLIRPDLDIAETSSSSVAFTGRDPQLTMKPITPSPTGTIDSFRYMMRFAYQRCDLSVRPIFNQQAGTGLTLQTNNLTDLQRPENRFGHYVIPLNSSSFGQNGFGEGTTLPILALTAEPDSSINPSVGNYRNLTDQAYGFLSSASPNMAVRPLDRGFIPSCFFRSKIRRDPSAPHLVASAVPTLEEIVATNVVAFDIKGYDLAVKQLSNPGADGGWGIASYDDNGDGQTDNLAEAGWPSTDDLSLTPSDPGFSKTLINSNAPTMSNSGAFVDLDWPRKVIHAPHRIGNTINQLTNATAITRPNTLWMSNLSCVQLNQPNSNVIQRSSGLVRSGNYFATAATGVIVYQPCYDTYTDAYEVDGEWIQLLDSGDAAYVAWRDGLRRFGVNSTLSGSADRSSDGIGTDNFERETAPPISYKMPSIQATIRVQDSGAGTLQQISVVHELN